MKESTKPFPARHLEYIIKHTEQMEFWTNMLVSSKCLSEDSKSILKARKLIAESKEQILRQGHTVRTLTEIEFINGSVIFPQQFKNSSENPACEDAL